MVKYGRFRGILASATYLIENRLHIQPAAIEHANPKVLNVYGHGRGGYIIALVPRQRE